MPIGGRLMRGCGSSMKGYRGSASEGDSTQGEPANAKADMEVVEKENQNMMRYLGEADKNVRQANEELETLEK
ncbi:hypothetical protein IAR50_001580 [Cryptococcus sp. DSM 104548]